MHPGLSLTIPLGWSPYGHHKLTECQKGMERTIRLTKRVVDDARPLSGRYVLWDAELKGSVYESKRAGRKPIWSDIDLKVWVRPLRSVL